MGGVGEHMSIGAFARVAGITPSALRFYDECGLVRPAAVDPATGYRSYSTAQLDEVLLIRRLREAGLPLVDVRRVLAGPPTDASALLTRHLESMERAVAATRALLDGFATPSGVALPGRLLAEAVSQVAPAAARGGEFPVLGGVLFELAEGELRLVATDRYRLAIRSLPISQRVSPGTAVVSPDAAVVSPGAVGTAVVDVGALEALYSWLAAQDTVRLLAAADELRIGDRSVATLRDPFPDYRVILDGLPAPIAQVVAPREAFLEALGTDLDARLDLLLDGSLRVASTEVPAAITGGPVAISFQCSTLSPAVAAAIGPDVLLRIAAPDLPVVVHSADDSDFTTLIMPVKGAR
ncbi:MerR family transcriptional regulator [Dactylosporangium sp. CS-047395]|uniref:DNA polymerase III subunit beta family protein n=1 Tax=Dactylosporangium sp. CS-047395 TaxID=3239936 RepID=UPI003D934D26